MFINSQFLSCCTSQLKQLRINQIITVNSSMNAPISKTSPKELLHALRAYVLLRDSATQELICQNAVKMTEINWWYMHTNWDFLALNYVEIIFGAPFGRYVVFLWRNLSAALWYNINRIMFRVLAFEWLWILARNRLPLTYFASLTTQDGNNLFL